jgi:ketosteroid isomerase-like protein
VARTTYSIAIPTRQELKIALLAGRWLHEPSSWSRPPWPDQDRAFAPPVGGFLRGTDAIAALYQKALGGPANITVTLSDVVAFHGPSHAVFAGLETGWYTAADGGTVPLKIRTTRYFRYADGHWREYHHHGSIDDPDALRGYQKALRG